MNLRVASSRVIVVLLAALAASCARGPSQEARQCLDTLGKRGIAFTTVGMSPPSGGCGIDGGIELHQSTIPFDQPATMGCALALAVVDFETRVVQPLAQYYFGQPVTVLRHFGAYSCRASTGGRGRLSQHGLGKAFDVRGFRLADGTTIDVKTDWSTRGPKSSFLRDLAREACRTFSVVLTPNSDRDHQDHIHLDIGPYKQCGA